MTTDFQIFAVLVILILFACMVYLQQISRALGAPQQLKPGDPMEDGPTAYTAPPAAPIPQESGTVQLLRRTTDGWARLGERPADHHDVAEVRAGLHPGVCIRGEEPQ